jgi:hypothetical protein
MTCAAILSAIRPASQHRRPSPASWSVLAALLLTLTGYSAFAALSLAAPSALTAPSSATLSPAAPSGGIGGPSGDDARDDIHDIRGPKPIDSGWLVPALVLAGLLATAGAYAAWRWHSRRRRAYDATPLDIARERLERARQLLSQGLGREFSIEVSSAVREYIESRFQMMAAHRTTDEFLHDLLQTTDPALAAHRGLLENFLQSCDLAKFGGGNLSIENMEALLHSARRFVVESAPPQASGPPQNSALEDTVSQSTATKSTYDSLPTT